MSLHFDVLYREQRGLTETTVNLIPFALHEQAETIMLFVKDGE